MSFIHSANRAVQSQKVEAKKWLSWVSRMMDRVCMGFQALLLQTKATERIEMRYLLSGLAAKLHAPTARPTIGQQSKTGAKSIQIQTKAVW